MNFRNVGFLAAAWILLFLFMELISRSALFAITHDAASFQYGWRRGISLEYEKGKFQFLNANAAEKTGTPSLDKTAATLLEGAASETARFLAFGGSTTYGYNCSADASSWPEELEKFLEKSGIETQIKNFGWNGTNSDYAVVKLETAALPFKPDYVLWAHFVNESDILAYGPDLNYEILKKEFPQFFESGKKQFFGRRANLFWLRLDKSLAGRSTAYWFFSRAVHSFAARVSRKFAKQDSQSEAWLSPESLRENQVDFTRLVLRNYELNFKRALDFCRKHQMQLVVVQLPLDKTQFNAMLEARYGAAAVQFYNAFWNALEKSQKDLCTQNQSLYIDVLGAYKNGIDLSSDFCDGAHQTRQGHETTARILGEVISHYLNFKKMNV